ncbi:DUF520 family protein, partial [Klebsiella pneumoniae]
VQANKRDDLQLAQALIRKELDYPFSFGNYRD